MCITLVKLLNDIFESRFLVSGSVVACIPCLLLVVALTWVPLLLTLLSGTSRCVWCCSRAYWWRSSLVADVCLRAGTSAALHRSLKTIKNQRAVLS